MLPISRNTDVMLGYIKDERVKETSLLSVLAAAIYRTVQCTICECDRAAKDVNISSFCPFLDIGAEPPPVRALSDRILHGRILGASTK